MFGWLKSRTLELQSAWFRLPKPPRIAKDDELEMISPIFRFQFTGSPVKATLGQMLHMTILLSSFHEVVAHCSRPFAVFLKNQDEKSQHKVNSSTSSENLNCHILLILNLREPNKKQRNYTRLDKSPNHHPKLFRHLVHQSKELYKPTYFILLSLGQGKGFKSSVQEQHIYYTKEAHANKTTEQTYAQQLAYSTTSLPREKNSSILIADFSFCIFIQLPRNDSLFSLWKHKQTTT